MNKNEVRVKLNEIFKNVTNVDFLNNAIINNIQDVKLFAKSIDLNPRYLVYIFFEIQKKFGIKIPQEDIVEGRFATFNDIQQCICKQLNCVEE